MTDTPFSRAYRSPDIAPGRFAMRPVVAISSGVNRVVIDPNELDAVIDALEDAAEWISDREDAQEAHA